jgi:hypothetical protein
MVFMDPIRTSVAALSPLPLSVYPALVPVDVYTLQLASQPPYLARVVGDASLRSALVGRGR